MNAKFKQRPKDIVRHSHRDSGLRTPMPVAVMRRSSRPEKTSEENGLDEARATKFANKNIIYYRVFFGLYFRMKFRDVFPPHIVRITYNILGDAIVRARVLRGK